MSFVQLPDMGAIIKKTQVVLILAMYITRSRIIEKLSLSKIYIIISDVKD